MIILSKHRKSGTFPQNCCPISLLPAISKIVEKITAVRIQQRIDEIDIFLDEQFEFKYQHTTVQQVLRMVE